MWPFLRSEFLPLYLLALSFLVNIHIHTRERRDIIHTEWNILSDRKRNGQNLVQLHFFFNFSLFRLPQQTLIIFAFVHINRFSYTFMCYNIISFSDLEHVRCVESEVQRFRLLSRSSIRCAAGEIWSDIQHNNRAHLPLTGDREFTLHAAIFGRLLGARVVLDDVPKSHHFVDLKVTHWLHLLGCERVLEDYQREPVKCQMVRDYHRLTNGHRSVKSLRRCENAMLGSMVIEQIANMKIVNLSGCDDVDIFFVLFRKLSADETTIVNWEMRIVLWALSHIIPGPRVSLDARSNVVIAAKKSRKKHEKFDIATATIKWFNEKSEVATTTRDWYEKILRCSAHFLYMMRISRSNNSLAIATKCATLRSLIGWFSDASRISRVYEPY